MRLVQIEERNVSVHQPERNGWMRADRRYICPKERIMSQKGCRSEKTRLEKQ